jgi:arylsulfatase A-like enzyme
VGMTSPETPTNNPEPASDTPTAGVLPGASPRPSQWALLGQLVLVGIRSAVSLVAGLWLGDAAFLAATRGGATWGQWLMGVGAALFVALTTAIVSGALLGPVFVPLVRFAARSIREKAGALRDGGQDARHAFAADTLALAVVLAVWCPVTFRIVLLIVFGVARNDTMALAMSLSHVVFAATLVFAWSAVRRVTRVVVDRVARVRWLRWLVARAWMMPALLLGVGAAVGVVFIVRYRQELAALPWLEAIPLPGLAAGAVAVLYLPRARPVLRRVAFALCALALAASVVAAGRLRPESSTAQSIGFDRALTGRLGYAAWSLALDFDRDGQISILGGGDCAPFDPSRYTGATEVPDNGVDEDCDGIDLAATSMHPRSRQPVGQDKLPSRPNVIFITIDALAAPRLMQIGAKTQLMPHLDDLAKRSMLFTHCLSQGPSTRLSFPSMFTSRYDSQLVFEYAPRFPWPLAQGEHQLQDDMDDAGYETVAVIPNNYFERSRWSSVTRGFQQVDTSALDGPHHNAPQVTDAAIRVLSQKHDRPLYMWVHYYDAHPPYEPLPGVEYPEPGPLAFYETALTYIDKELARLLAVIEKRTDPTYIIVSSDHATVFHPVPALRHFNYGYDLYTATLHVPLIVHGPGVHPGHADDEVSTMDIYPTITDLVRAPERGKLEGTSLLPELLTTQRDPERVTYHEFYLPENLFRGLDPLELVSAHSDHYNLVLNRKRGTYELYDWHKDYFEMHDIYEEEVRAPEVTHMRSMLGAFIQQYYKRQGIADRSN